MSKISKRIKKHKELIKAATEKEIKVENTFTNELGNKITVYTKAETKDGVEGITMYISGPTSEHENFITILEAEEIFKQLANVLAELANVEND